MEFVQKFTFFDNCYFVIDPKRICLVPKQKYIFSKILFEKAAKIRYDIIVSFQAGITTIISRIAVQETGVCRHHIVPIKGLFKKKFNITAVC